MRNAITIVSLAAVALCSTAWQTVGPTKPPVRKARLSAKKVRPDGPSPKITLSAESWDFGDVLFGDTPMQIFTIKNDGDADLILGKVKGSCSCTVPKLKTKVLKPGESTEVTVNFNTKKKQGQISTLVSVRSNDPVRPIVTYRVKGNVRRLIDVSPTSIQLNGIQREEAMSGTVRILSRTDEAPIKPTLKSINSDHFDVKITEVEAGRVYEVVVTTKPPIPYGTTRAGIEISTGLDRQPTIRIPVNANVRARVSVSPPILFVPKQSISSSNRRIRIRYYGTDENFKVLSVVSSDPEKLPIELQPMGNAPGLAVRRRGAAAPKLEQVVAVTVPPGAELGDSEYTIVIRTNDKEFEEIVIPVTGNTNTFRKSLGLRPSPTPRVSPAVKRDGAPGAKPVAKPSDLVKPAPAKAKTDDKP